MHSPPQAGARFGRLEVASQDGKLGAYTAYLCRCDCGKDVRIKGVYLTSGDTKSCGCLKLEASRRNGLANKIPIEIGARFGRLVVLEESGHLGAYIAYRCRCDCGNEIRARGPLIRAGHTKSCGCLKLEVASKNGSNTRFAIDLGARFARLVVVDESGSIGASPAYLCRCDCGNELRVRGSSIVSGRTKSCGCLQRESARRTGLATKLIIAPGTKFGKLEVVRESGHLGSDISHLCLCACGSETTVTASNLVSGGTRSCGCVKSHVEVDLLNFVRSQLPETEVIPNDRSVLKPKELDVWIPSRGLAIEFNGTYWHGESIAPDKKLSSYQKYLACRGYGVRLITIFEDEWKLRRPVVEGYLRSILGQKKTVGARKCAVEMVDSSQFLGEHHLQGSANGVHYQLALNGSVMAAAVFAKTTNLKAMGEQGVWELTRYAALPELSIAGGASKLLKAFLRDTPECKTVISYSDNRWSEGGMYKAMGFRCERESKPSFSYFSRGSLSRVHRFNWRKSEALRVYGGSPDETEWEIMQRNGWDRIWDCGKKRWQIAAAAII